MGGCITHIDRGEGEVGAKLRFRKSEDLGREKTERVATLRYQKWGHKRPLTVTYEPHGM